MTRSRGPEQLLLPGFESTPHPLAPGGLSSTRLFVLAGVAVVKEARVNSDALKWLQGVVAAAGFNARDRARLHAALDKLHRVSAA